MGYLAENSELHNQSWGLLTPYHWRVYSAWQLIADLQRRHPGEYSVFESYYKDGIPDIVWHVNTKVDPYAQTVAPSWEDTWGRMVLTINTMGSVTVWQAPDNHKTVCQLHDGLPADANDRYNTLDILLSTDVPRNVTEIEICAGIHRPPTRPSQPMSAPTQASTVGYRVIAAALALSLHTKKPLSVKGLLFDGVDYRKQLVSKLNSNFVWQVVEITTEKNLNQVFCLHETKPGDNPNSEPGEVILAVDCNTGIAYTSSSEINLMKSFESSGRDIDAVAFELVRLARLDMK